MNEPVIEYATPRGHDPAMRRLVKVWTAIGVAVLLVLGFLIIAPAFETSPRGSSRVKCASNLRQIGQGIMLYAWDHQGRWPDTLDELIVKADLPPYVFVCPSSYATAAPGATSEEQARNLYNGGHLSFVYLGKGLRDPVDADRVIAYEVPGHHETPGMNVLFGDGHVEWFNEPMAKQILADLAAGWNPPKRVVSVSQRAAASHPAR